MSDPGIVPSDAVDVVGVFDSGFQQLFDGARPLRALIREGSKLPEHTVETGATIGDHRVFLPVLIELHMILTPENYQDIFQQIKTAWKDTAALSVQTKADTYSNMFIEEMPHDEQAEMFDTVAVAVKLKQVRFVNAQYAQLPPSKVKKKSNASTTKTGQKQATESKKSSAAYDLIFGNK